MAKVECLDEFFKWVVLFFIFMGLWFGDIWDLKWKEVWYFEVNGYFLCFIVNKFNWVEIFFIFD